MLPNTSPEVPTFPLERGSSRFSDADIYKSLIIMSNGNIDKAKICTKLITKEFNYIDLLLNKLHIQN